MKNSALIVEIFDGYSPIEFRGETLYMRHIGLRDQSLLYRVYERRKKEVLESGILTEKEILKRLNDDGIWTEKEEMDLEGIKFYIKNLEKSRSQVTLRSQKLEYDKLLNGEVEKLNTLLFKRRQLVGRTAEELSNSRSNEEFIRNLIYRDRELKTLRFSVEEFDNLEDDELAELMQGYTTLSERINEDSIKTVVLQDEFGMYLSQCDNATYLFGCPAKDLTLFQLKMLAYGKIFLSIFQNYEVPEAIKKDAQDVLDFAESQRNKDKGGKNSHSKHKSVGVVGAKNKEDLEHFDPSAKIIDFNEEIKKNGGKMSMDQIAKLTQ